MGWVGGKTPIFSCFVLCFKAWHIASIEEEHVELQLAECIFEK